MLQSFYNMIEDQKIYYAGPISRAFELVHLDHSSFVFWVSGLTNYKAARSHFQCPVSQVLSPIYNNGPGSWVPPLTSTGLIFLICPKSSFERFVIKVLVDFINPAIPFKNKFFGNYEAIQLVIKIGNNYN